MELSNAKKLKAEYNRPSFRKKLREKLGCKCANCGSESDIQYHHIVPLALNGTNNLTNIAPLCWKRHQFAHGSVNIRKLFRAEKTGRKRKLPPDDYEIIIDNYLKGEIGRKECQEKLNLGETGRLSEKWYFKDYLKKNKIVSYKNKIDLYNSPHLKHVSLKGVELAEIMYENGKRYVKIG